MAVPPFSVPDFNRGFNNAAPTQNPSQPIIEMLPKMPIPTPTQPFFKDTTSLGFDFPGSFSFAPATESRIQDPTPQVPFVQPTVHVTPTPYVPPIVDPEEEYLEEEESPVLAEDTKNEAVVYLTGFRDRVNQEIAETEGKLAGLLAERDGLEAEIQMLINPPAPEPEPEPTLEDELLSFDPALQSAVIKVLKKLEAQGTITVKGN